MLRILGRRPDGYHNLQSVFQFLDFGDSLRVRCRDDGVIRLANPQPGIRPEDDLVCRAARALQQASQTPLGADIWLDKHIPLGGGLGGGSSNAATTLMALNRLWRLDLAQERLMQLGIRLGADVPIFLFGKAAWAEGVGERLTPMELPCPWYLVLTPACQVSTAAVFADPQLTRDTPPITIADFLRGARDNSCEPLVRDRYPLVDGLMRWLGRHTKPYLTGTGASVFGIFDDRTAAEAVLKQAKGLYQGFVAKGLNISPVLNY